MPFTTLPTKSPGDVIQASYLNLIKADLDDHEDRVVDLETAIGAGGVTGPVSSTDNAIPRFDGTGGATLQNSGITIPDGASGSVNGVNTGDVTLAGVPSYLTIFGQIITRTLIDLASHITGRLPFANLTAATAANRLLGRGSTSGAGDFQEISLGAGLSMAGSTLSATGGGGSSALDDLTDVIITTPATNDILQYDGAEWVNQPLAGGAPTSASYVTLGTNATLTSERVLTGTSNQITVTDAGAGSTVTLSTPQNLHTSATPQWAREGIGVAADASAKLKIAGQYGSTTVAAGNSSTSKTLDWDDGNTQLLTLTGNCTLTLSNPKDGFRYLIALLQDGTGTRTVTWPSAVKWQAGTAPTLSTTAGKCDIVTLVWIAGIGASGNYLAAANTNYTPA
jgi:hypothetical protein